MDPHLRIRSSSFVSGPGRSNEPLRPPTPGHRSRVLATLAVVVAGSTVVAVAAEIVAAVV